MKILSIETSCDETAVSLVEATGDFPSAEYKVLGNALRSQIEAHRAYGGVFPSVAKRDHAAIITFLLSSALKDSGLAPTSYQLTGTQKEDLTRLLEREVGLVDELINYVETIGLPPIDLISVTAGPGLEPALWVGLNFAKALSIITDAPLLPANHLEGHILASLFNDGRIANINFPSLSLLISGGHTEFILMSDWHQYEKIGQTRDDAVGEAFDKVARLLGLPYPGGPEISRLASYARGKQVPPSVSLPRPMLDSDDLDVSFSGIKTAVRYAIQDKDLTDDERAAVAREFEDAVTEVLIKKAKRAIDMHNVRSFVIGGGVSANRYIRDTFKETLALEYPDLALYIPDPSLSTDNSIMIALVGHAHENNARQSKELGDLKAEGNKQHRKIPVGGKAF